MQKSKIFLSLLFCFCLVYFSELSNSKQSLSPPSFPTEHSILLNLSSKTDRIIYDNLIFSNYACSLLNPKQAQCVQFKPQGNIISSDGAVELYKHKTRDGQTLKIFKLANGEAHIEFKVKSSQTLYRYSFSSIDQISHFTREKGLFPSDPAEWDMSSLEYIL